MTTYNHTPISAGAPGQSSVVNAPLASLDAAMGDVDDTGAASLAVAVGNLALLGTTSKDSIVAAIGSAALRTDYKAKLIPAINEVYDDATAAQATATAAGVAAAAAQATASSALGAASAVTDEVTAARGGQVDLDTRLDNIALAGSGVSTLTNGAASAGQKVINVDSTTGILAGALISYTLVGGAIQTNTVDVVNSSTQLTCITNVGTGGIADNTYLSMIPVGILMSSGAVVGGVQQPQEFEDGVRISSTDGSTAKWVLKPTYANFSGVRDEVLFIGWNVNGISGARLDTAEAAIYTALEAEYYEVGSGIYWSEWYIEFVAAGTPVTIQRRPFSASINRANGDIINQFFGQNIFHKSDGTLTWQFDAAGNLTTPSGILRSGTNDATFITQLNAAANAYYSLIKLDSHDQVFVGDGGVSVNTADGVGRFGVGTTSQDSKLHVSQTDAGTNNIVQMSTTSRNSSGATAAGFGQSHLFELSNDSYSDQPAAKIVVAVNDPTAGAPKNDLILYAYDLSQREGLRIRGNGSAPAIGFLGATPIERPTGVAVSAAGIHAALVSLGLIAA